ncbi:MAG: class I SAM-dependent rRNA methyltransferase [Ferruginibacter sp.]|nr:class I SAM-dependent rRNA methyltransferase [Cytophagales bacterium]
MLHPESVIQESIASLPRLVLKPGREKSALNRHPWIFSGAVQQLPRVEGHSAENGTIVEVLSGEKALIGYGFFSPDSQITCRLFEFTSQPVDVHAPDYWHQKVGRAFALRQRYLVSSATNCYRLLHAEGDFFPGIIADVYGEIAVVQVLIKGAELIHPFIVEALRQVGISTVYLKNKLNSGFLEQVKLANGWLTPRELPGRVTVRENGLSFLIDFERGQKTGFFLDQRENRALLRQYATGKKVLNAFSYTGGFSVYALAGGATEVHSVDVSKDALQLGDENVALNFPGGAAHQSFATDCFEYLRETENHYDVMVLDPPAFAKNARSVPNATRGYKELNLKALRKVNPGGLIFTFSCSQHIDRDLFRKIVFGAAADAGRNVRILHQLSQPADHPINLYHPESEYLKGLVLYVE